MQQDFFLLDTWCQLQPTLVATEVNISEENMAHTLEIKLLKTKRMANRSDKKSVYKCSARFIKNRTCEPIKHPNPDTAPNQTQVDKVLTHVHVWSDFVFTCSHFLCT